MTDFKPFLEAMAMPKALYGKERAHKGGSSTYTAKFRGTLLSNCLEVDESEFIELDLSFRPKADHRAFVESLMEAHLKRYVETHKLQECLHRILVGFGDECGSGQVVIKSRKPVPKPDAMGFQFRGEWYMMLFD